MKSLHLCILAAAGWSLGSLLFQRARVAAYGKRELFAQPAGKPSDGIRYAFTKGMSPMAKESVRENLPSYMAGMIYHLGAFTAFALLALDIIGYTPAQILPFRVLLCAGALGGFSLLFKRLTKPSLRGLSNPDDYVSNLLVTVFITLAAMGLHQAWLISALVLLVYLPLGKIRHCLFFFSTRAAFGAFFGRRGVFPVQPSGSSHGR